ncbi:MAG: hypothetical protein U0792_14710 [Gemmataceae bacterium]
MATPLTRAADPVKETTPDNTGPVKLLTASWLGGPQDDALVGVEVISGAILLAGNTVDLPTSGATQVVLGPTGELTKDWVQPVPKKGQKAPSHPSTHGFIARLSLDGQKVLGLTRFGYGKATIRKLRLDAAGTIYLLAEATEALDLSGVKVEKGTFVAALSPDAGKVLKVIPHAKISDFGVDANGEVVLLTDAKLVRYTADGKGAKWTATWTCHGQNRPGALAVSPDTGVAAVVGYGMTHTGKEPYKDPYGYGFDREGKQVWGLWNPDPKKEKDVKFSTPEFKTNGLMADTTGHAASVGAGGKMYFMLFADGGNSVCTRDPADVEKPLDEKVFAGVFQKGPGYGFKGASKTSVIFRLDSAKGTLEKGTWMCAWLDRAHANGLGIDAATSDASGRQFLVGGSAFGCPTKSPWYVCQEGGYQGGGFLAILDSEFRMLQCGYFPGASISAVAVRGETLVIAGSAKEHEDPKSQSPIRAYKPLQRSFGGGARDGYFAVFKIYGK